MKRLLLLGLGTGLALAAGVSINRSQAQPAINGGVPAATLKQPWDTAAPATAPGANAAPYVQAMFNSNPAPGPTMPFGGPGTALPATGLPEWQEKPDINADIAIKEEQGPWVIFVECYAGPEAPMLARQMVAELRGAYKLAAYVHNHGAEERRKEYERIRQMFQKQREALQQHNMPLTMPLRVRHTRIEEQCAVLIGGYRDDNEARRALEQVRKLKPPDPTKVRLAQIFYSKDADVESTQINKGEQVFANPFKRAFVSRNPKARTERPADSNKLDRADIEKLNRYEPFSLLKAPHPCTLVVKQFATTMIFKHDDPGASSGGFLANLGFGKKNDIDAAATNAHNLAELFRKQNIDAYVLHTRYYSVVTIGSYASLQDPALQQMQHLLETRLKLDQRIGLMSKPMPWDVRLAMAGS